MPFCVRKKMGKALGCCLGFICFLIPVAVAEWDILKQKPLDGLKISLKNYCESWRVNVELHNIKDFQVVPEECTEYIGKYVKSTQYTLDSERAIEACLVYLGTRCNPCNVKRDGKDAWIFDIDDTLLSTLPFYKNNLYGGKKLNVASLEEWMSTGNAPALQDSLKLFNELKYRGVNIFLVSARREHLRSATVENLVKVGYYGWTNLVLRGPADELVTVEKYKYEARQQIMNNGYHIWGIVGDQYSSIKGIPSTSRAFKLPNPMYYVA